MLPTRDPFQTLEHTQTESEGMGNNVHKNANQKKAGVAILISDKIDFRLKSVVRDKEGYYIMIKGSIHKEYIKL